MAVSVSDICENTKLAREMSLLGNYETATVYYQGVVQQIHRYNYFFASLLMNLSLCLGCWAALMTR